MYSVMLSFRTKNKTMAEILSTVHVELDDFFLTANNSWGERGGLEYVRGYLVHTLTFVHVFSARREWHSSIFGAPFLFLLAEVCVYAYMYERKGKNCIIGRSIT